jgi:hypothetical protein
VDLVGTSSLVDEAEVGADAANVAAPDDRDVDPPVSAGVALTAYSDDELIGAE